MSNEAVVRLLGATTAFRALDSDDLSALAATAQVRRFGAGEHVFTRGDVGGGMFVVASGSVALVVNAASGNEVVLAVLSSPASFGEMAVIDGGPRVATALVRVPSVLVALPRPEVQRVLRAHPAVSLAMLSLLSGIVRSVDEHVADLVLLDLAGRVAKLLLAATVRPGVPPAGDGAVAVSLTLSQSELARIVGGSRQQVNRILGEFADAGAILRSGARITAVRPDRLSLWLDAP